MLPLVVVVVVVVVMVVVVVVVAAVAVHLCRPYHPWFCPQLFCGVLRCVSASLNEANHNRYTAVLLYAEQRSEAVLEFEETRSVVQPSVDQDAK